METSKKILITINVVGGIAVIGSYILGIGSQSGGTSALWGGVPEDIQPIYGLSMLLAALGYFLFIFFIIVKLKPKETVISGRFGYNLFNLIFILILLPSALWMPLTSMYVEDPNVGLSFAIRFVLTIVGLASIALVWSITKIGDKRPLKHFQLAVLGSAYFAFHTFVLDAVIWSVLFE
jgi:hypothetical protein